MKKWIEKHSLVLSMTLVLAVMGMIFCFSAQTGQSSGALSGRITAKIVRLFVPNLDTFPESEQQSILKTAGFLVRKGAHFSEFALLGFSLMLHILQWKKRTTVRVPWLWAWTIGTAYAISDEIHQHFVGGRYPAVTDVCIDSSGVLAGILFLMGLLWCLSRRNRNKC